jgi:hypothetical protein
MRHETLTAAELAPQGTIPAILAQVTADSLLDTNFPGLRAALDRTYGRDGWFMFWDEDLRGQPVTGTIAIAYGKETLIVG